MGSQNGRCRNVVSLERGERIESIRVGYDTTVRSIEFVKSDGTSALVGKVNPSGYEESIWNTQVFEFGQGGQELLGIYGVHEEDKHGSHIKSIGFVTNQCSDERLR